LTIGLKWYCSWALLVKMLAVQVALLSVVVAVVGAQAARQGTLLSLPVYELCRDRHKQWKFNGSWYHFSWDAEASAADLAAGGTGNKTADTGKKVNWLEARNNCRTQCMDAVGMETYQEDQMVVDFLKKRNLTYIWTSGRLCDFHGCEVREDLKPINVNGWFWSSTNKKIAPTNDTVKGWPHQPWSQTGHYKKPQPDNAEFSINKTPESCLGVLNNLYEDGIKWHDIACYHPKPFICEDNAMLLEYIRLTNVEAAAKDNFS